MTFQGLAIVGGKRAPEQLSPAPTQAKRRGVCAGAESSSMDAELEETPRSEEICEKVEAGQQVDPSDSAAENCFEGVDEKEESREESNAEEAEEAEAEEAEAEEAEAEENEETGPISKAFSTFHANLQEKTEKMAGLVSVVSSFHLRCCQCRGGWLRFLSWSLFNLNLLADTAD